MEIPITGTSMRLLTKMRYKGGLGVNVQGITRPLEVEKKPRFVSLMYTEGKFSKVLEASMTLLNPLRK